MPCRIPPLWYDVAMASESVLKAFLFTDIVGATDLKRRIGDVAGADAIARHDEIFRNCMTQFGGEEHENPGDSFFASFDVPSNALRCAMEFVNGLQQLDLPDAISARIGIHMGESVRVIESSGMRKYRKLLGLAIDTTARVMGLARAGQILLTRHAFDSVRQQVVKSPGGRDVQWLAHGPYRLKGIDDPMEIFEAGVEGSPMRPPPDTEDARRALQPGEEETLGWRPAVGLAVPGRESWELERQLGEGGFGEVWLARHKETRYVRAFKFCFKAEELRSLKREMKLFRLMKEVLGDRDDIARLYEVRLLEPPYYLEMEYTAGGNLAEWADSRGGLARVPLETRLELIAQVGDALAAAHSVGIIHKDLKPANVLIHEGRDGSVQVRLTDFGIGELVKKDKLREFDMTISTFESVATLKTSSSSYTGGHMYVAPELFSGQPSTSRTDIYALGVLLYQVVLADLMQPVAYGWERNVPDELLQEDIAACVGGDPKTRLPTAEQLSQRLRALDQRRAERQAQHRRERARRRVMQAATGLMVLLALVAGAAGVGYWRTTDALRMTQRAQEQAVRDHERALQAERRAREQADLARLAESRARKEAEKAQHEADKAAAITEFLQSLLISSSPAINQGAELTVREVLEDAALRLEESLEGQPEVAAAVHETIARTFETLGVPEKALQHATQALANVPTDAAGAEAVVDRLRLRGYVAWLRAQIGQTNGVEAELRTVVRALESRVAEHDPHLAAARVHLAEFLAPLNKLEEAERLYRQALASRQKTFGDDDPATFEAVNNLASFLKSAGRLDESCALHQKLYATQQKVLGGQHPQTLMTANNLAGALKDLNRFKESESLYRLLIERLPEVLGNEHPHVCASFSNYASLLTRMEQFEDAEGLYRKALDCARRSLGGDHPTTLALTNNLADVLGKMGRNEDAAVLFGMVVDTADRILPDGHWYRAAFAGRYGECLYELGRYAEAEPQLLAAYEQFSDQLDTKDPRTQAALTRLVRLYRAWDKSEQAAHYETLQSAEAP